MKRLNYKKIDELRKERGWSRNELARRIGVTSAAISLMFNRHSNPSLETAIAIARELETTVDELLEEIQTDKEDDALAVA